MGSAEAVASTSPRALVTGASSGIGEAFARALAHRGQGLVLVARRTDRLRRLAEELGGEDVALPLSADLTRRGAVEDLVAELERRKLHVDLLVNNAGLGETGAFHEQAWERVQAMLDLNVRALTEFTWRVLPGMIERHHGRIINVSSTGAFQSVPFLNIYAATKAFVLSFTESLHTELAGTGVHVQALCPGYTETEFFDVSHTSPRLWVNRVPRMSPQRVAAESLRRLAFGKPRVVPGWNNRLMVALVRWLPSRFVRRMGASLYRPR